MRINQRRFHVFTRPPEREGVGGGLGSAGGGASGRAGRGLRRSERREGGAWRKALRGKRGEQGRAVRAPRTPARPRRGVPHFLSLSVGPGPRNPSPQPPASGPRGRGGPLPDVMSVGSKDGLRTYLLGQTARKQAGPGEEEGRQKNGVPPKAAGDRNGGSEGRRAWGVGDRNSREKHAEMEGGREEGGKEREENQLHRHDPLPPRGAKGPEPHRERAPPGIGPGSSSPLPPGQVPGQEGPPRGGHPPRKGEDKTPSPWPEAGGGAQVSCRTNWLCDLRTTSCPLWTAVRRPTWAHTFRLHGDLSPGALSSPKG